MEYLLGIDIGTSGTKTVLFDTDGHVAASKTVEYPMAQPQNGWAEQNPEDWWQAVCTGARAPCLSRAAQTPLPCAALGCPVRCILLLCWTNTTRCASGYPVVRPAHRPPNAKKSMPLSARSGILKSRQTRRSPDLRRAKSCGCGSMNPKYTASLPPYSSGKGLYPLQTVRRICHRSIGRIRHGAARRPAPLLVGRGA